MEVGAIDIVRGLIGASNDDRYWALYLRVLRDGFLPSLYRKLTGGRLLAAFSFLAGAVYPGDLRETDIDFSALTKARSIAEAEGDGEAIGFVANVLARRRDFTRAEEWYRVASASHRGDVTVGWLYVCAFTLELIGRGKYLSREEEEAMDCLSEASEKYADILAKGFNSPEVWCYLGDTKAWMGRVKFGNKDVAHGLLSEACSHYRESLKGGPRSPRTTHHWGQALLDLALIEEVPGRTQEALERHEQALKMLEEALRSGPRSDLAARQLLRAVQSYARLTGGGRSLERQYLSDLCRTYEQYEVEMSGVEVEAAGWGIVLCYMATVTEDTEQARTYWTEGLLKIVSAASAMLQDRRLEKFVGCLEEAERYSLHGPPPALQSDVVGLLLLAQANIGTDTKTLGIALRKGNAIKCKGEIWAFAKTVYEEKRMTEMPSRDDDFAALSVRLAQRYLVLSAEK